MGRDGRRVQFVTQQRQSPRDRLDIPALRECRSYPIGSKAKNALSFEKSTLLHGDNGFGWGAAGHT